MEQNKNPFKFRPLSSNNITMENTKTPLSQTKSLAIAGAIILGVVLMLSTISFLGRSEEPAFAAQIQEINRLTEQEKQTKITLLKEKSKLTSALRSYTESRAQREELKKKIDDVLNQGLTPDQVKTVEKIVSDPENVAFSKAE